MMRNVHARTSRVRLNVDGRPAVLDFVTFTVGCASRVAIEGEALLDEIRCASGADHDEGVLRAALFSGLAEQGWNKALDAAEHADLATRASQRAELLA
jgi:hypothetical protein